MFCQENALAPRLFYAKNLPLLYLFKCGGAEIDVLLILLILQKKYLQIQKNMI